MNIYKYFRTHHIAAETWFPAALHTTASCPKQVPVDRGQRLHGCPRLIRVHAPTGHCASRREPSLGRWVSGTVVAPLTSRGRPVLKAARNVASAFAGPPNVLRAACARFLSMPAAARVGTSLSGGGESACS